MKKTVLLSLLFASSLTVSGVSSAVGLAQALQEPTHKEKKDFSKSSKGKKSRSTASLEDTFADWVDAFNNKDIKSLMSIHGPDALYASEDSGLIEGADDLEDFYKALLPNANGELRYVVEAATVKGSLGVVVVNFGGSSEQSGSIQVVTSNRAMFTFKKALFGKWEMVYGMEQTATEVLPIVGSSSLGSSY